jgi:hypothetical protein
MAPAKGTQFWKLRNKHGRKKLFETPELLWTSACEYFDWCDNNPILSTKSSSSTQGTSTEEKEHQRPYTKQGLFFYLECSDDWLRNFRKTCNNDFLRVIEAIEQTIENQQVAHAMVGVFNANLVARLNGIKDHSDVTTNGKEIQQNISILNIDPLSTNEETNDSTSEN